MRRYFLIFHVVTAVSFLPSTSGAGDPCQPVLEYYKMYLAWSDVTRSDPWNAEEFRKRSRGRLTQKCIERTLRQVAHEHFDPIVQAQDYSPDWKNHLSASVVAAQPDQVTCRVMMDPAWPQEVVVRLKKQGKEYLIDGFEPVKR